MLVGELELLGSGLAGTVAALGKGISECLNAEERVGRTYSESTSAPSATTTDLAQVGQDAKGRLVTERNVDDTVVRKSAHSGQGSALLATTLGGSGDEQTGVLTPVGTGLPLAAGLVPEGLPLGREVAVTGGDTEEEGVVLLEGLGVLEGGDLGRLWWGVHLLKHLLGEGLGNLVQVARTTGGLNTLLFGLSNLLDVAIHRVLEID